MFPIVLDLSKLKIVLVGGGDAALERLKALDEAGAKNIRIFADNFGKEFWNLAGDRLATRMPTDEEIQSASAVMIVDIENGQAAALATRTKELGVLVNVEDRKEYCDFFFPSVVRHGDLIITVSTSGKSPTLAKRIRDVIGGIFYKVWAARLEDIAIKRDQWRNLGLNKREVADMTNRYIDDKGWLEFEELTNIKEKV
ncbi:MAG: siroheme synthase [Rickettsiaceae bacterium]|nr:siroheme synthase [Rickettsiaceae bacterium]